MPSISINSLIANLLPGRPSQFGTPFAPSPPPAAPQSEVVFTRGEPWRNQAGGSTQVGYTRRDAGGQQPVSDAQPLTADSQPGTATDEANSVAVGQGKDAQVEASPDAVKKPNGELLSKAEMAVLRELKKADQSVKTHEMAHLAAAGGYAKGAASYSYQRGPDGQNYAVGGEVQIDTGKESTPEATIQKMRVIRQAALAPVDPSPQDQRVASQATLQISESSKELQLAQASLSQTPPSPEAKVDDGTVQGIYQGAALGLIGANSASNSNKPSGVHNPYVAYSKSLPLASRSDRQGLDRIA